ncbi:MAG: DUF1847 domain-containing protein [Candidatus Heimdallarchaeota archaeon]
MNNKLESYNKKNSDDPTCYKCDCSNYCSTGRPSRELENCPIKTSPEIQKKAIELYETDDFIKRSNFAATVAKSQGIVSRLRNAIEYAKAMGFKKLGIASCGGLQTETRKTAEILLHYGFEVSSVSCPTGINKKINAEIPEEFTGYSKMGCNFNYISCNPVAQALLLNNAKTDMNIIIGLCVGHDVTFTHLSNAPVITLIAKDWVIPHNPSETLNSFYKEIRLKL